jgi:hypothetical protein
MDPAATLEAALPGTSGWTRKQVYGGTSQGTSQGAELWASALGRQVIVKHHREAPLGRFEAIGRRIQVLRDAGVPAPATTVGAHGADVLLIHDYLPGRSDPVLTSALIDDLIDIVEREAGLADDSAQDWPEVIRTSLTVGIDGHYEHGSLQNFSEGSRKLLQGVRQVGRDQSVGRLRAPDLVHYDLHTVNVLSDDGRSVSGIIDWDGVRAGDRSLDLAKTGVHQPVEDLRNSPARAHLERLPVQQHPRRTRHLHASRRTRASRRGHPPGRISTWSVENHRTGNLGSRCHRARHLLAATKKLSAASGARHAAHSWRYRVRVPRA